LDDVNIHAGLLRETARIATVDGGLQSARNKTFGAGPHWNPLVGVGAGQAKGAGR